MIPWGYGASLEWATSCPPPRHNFTSIPRIRSDDRRSICITLIPLAPCRESRPRLRGRQVSQLDAREPVVPLECMTTHTSFGIESQVRASSG